MDKIHLLNKKVALYQPDKGFKTTQDAVLLAAACPAKNTQSVLDIGCGVGGALFSLAWREPNLILNGLDIEPLYLDLAEKNAALNDKNVIIFQNDILEFRPHQPKDRFDHIICNPPYYDTNAHIASPDETKALAKGHQKDNESLNNWIDCAFQNVKSRGSLTLIHQAEHTQEIIVLLGKRFGAVEIIPIYSKSNEPAKRVIIRSYKDRKSGTKIHSGIIMHQDDLSPSKNAQQLLREGYSFDKIFAEQRMQT